jgi:hypothetical protein
VKQRRPKNLEDRQKERGKDENGHPRQSWVLPIANAPIAIK